ncbi:hypothetical protein HA402_004367 [Bradysia odoriphaga]|nr:hypothetical protein HA402_004367 [Bradysia odoriphaga]
MATYDSDYWNNQNQQMHQSFNFEMPEQFGQELNFQPIDATQQPSYAGSFYDPPANAYAGGIFTPTADNFESGGVSEFDDEPPLLEELGINPGHIMQKTLCVLNPFRTADQSILQDTDMAGPLVFCLALGGFLLLSGKVTFSYIYGIGVMGCIAFYVLLSLMATQSQVTLGAVISVLGYCILPMVVLSGINVLITVQGVVGTVFAGLCIFWCALSASKLFVTAYSMDHQQILIAYPCALLYGVFALITIF